MDAITLLKQDHRTVEALFRRFENGLDGDEKRDVVQTIIRELSVHAVIEEQVLYPAIKQAVPDGDDLAGEGIDEHQEVKETLAGLDGMDPSDGGFDQRVRSLIADVRHHVEEEENDMFPKLAAALSSDRLEEMGSAMESAKRVAPTRPHPHAPSTPPGNLIAGAVAGPLDRARDAATGRTARTEATKKSVAKKASAKKSTAKRPAAKRSSAKKTSTRKTSTRKAATRKASTRKAATRKTTTAKRTGSQGPVIHVTPTSDGGWRAERRGSDRAVATGDRKQDVVSRARDVAKRQRGRLVIHNAKGRIQEERTYGSDPRRSRG
jgi:hemerythrin superfamily protein